jgi:hypothetical protein
MRKLSVAVCLAAVPLYAGTLTPKERDAAIEYLQKSSNGVRQAVEKMTDAQWKFKPAPDRWSAAECVEHVVASDQMLFLFATEKLMAMPPSESPERRTDEAVIAASASRDRKVKTMEFLEPKSRFSSRKEALDALAQTRERIANYIRTTNADLRAHGIKSYGAYSDAYQFLLTISAHAERHTAQIEEVKASPGFPK